MSLLASESFLAPRVAGLQPSATFAMIARVRELQAQGAEILELTAGEPDFRPPEVAEKAAMEAIQAGKGRYTPASGTMALRQAAANWIESDFGLRYSPREVIVCPGAKIGISQALLALIRSGDEVLIPTPSWTSYPEMVRIAEGVPVMVPCDRNHLPDLEALEAARTSATKAILINSPCNPTGAVWPKDRLKALGEWALAHDLWVISDEIYAHLVYGDNRHDSPMALVPELQQRAVWIGGMSKAYAMTGWRIGFAAAPEALAKTIGGLQSQLASCPNSISQIASLAALQHGGEARQQMRQAFENRCRLVSERLAIMPGLECPAPQGAFYAFPRLQDSILGRRDPATGRQIQSGDDFIEVLLEADQVALMGGTAFGEPTAFRISFAASETVLTDALDRIAGRLQAIQNSGND
ncbi:MAG: pyridoxal phosphate-dependent aminotransferase [Planctomycetota bacterium]|nr:MAG: pyridoxal phosphate-dependent aminotransferase [Planctomycetota bacterium]